MLARLLERRGADLMHIYFGHTGVHLLPFIERWDKPCVVSFHGADVAKKTDIRDYGVEVAAVVSKRSRWSWRARSRWPIDWLVWDARRKNCGSIARACRCRNFRTCAAKRPRDGHWRLLQACRLIPKKGVATTLCAFAIFQKRISERRAGHRRQRSAATRISKNSRKSWGSASKVHFHGFLSQAELRDLYAQSHLFLHPSETPPDQNQEGIPNSVLEAMATGLPVAATRHGGIPEAVEHGRSGLLVDERDFEALANAMKEITRSPSAFREMGLLGSEFVAANFEQARADSAARIALRRSGRARADANVRPRCRDGSGAARFAEQRAGEIAFVSVSKISRAKNSESLLSSRQNSLL